MQGLELNSALNCLNYGEINDELRRVPSRIAAVQNGICQILAQQCLRREVIVVINVMEHIYRENSTSLQEYALNIGQQITNLEVDPI